MSNPKLFRNFQKSHFLIEESRRTFKYVSLKLKSKKLAYFTTGCHNFFLCKFLRSLPFVKSICKKLKATSLTHTFYQSFVLGPSCNVFSSKFQVTLHFWHIEIHCWNSRLICHRYSFLDNLAPNKVIGLHQHCLKFLLGVYFVATGSVR